MEIWEEEGERDSERRDGPGDEIGSDSVIRNFPMYSPPRSSADWRADQVQSPPLDLFGLQFGYEAYLPPATTTVCNVEAPLGLRVHRSLEKENRLSEELNLRVLRFLKEGNRLLEEKNQEELNLRVLRFLEEGNRLLKEKKQEEWNLKVLRLERLLEEKDRLDRLLEENYRLLEENDRLSEELPLEENAMKKLLRQDAQTFKLWPGEKIIQLDSSEERIFGELGAKNIGQKVESAEKSCIAISHSKKKNTIETPKRKCERLITFDDLRPHFGLKRADAAKILGVSVPTFKRCCRKNGIRWWNGDGCFPVEPKLLNNSAHQNSSGSKPPEVQGEKEISALLGARQDAVTIKAKYGEVNLKFQLSSESGFAELQEAVAKRLKSQAFTVEYEDEDQEPILIACDEDWQACVKFFGNQVITLAIREDFLL